MIPTPTDYILQVAPQWATALKIDSEFSRGFHAAQSGKPMPFDSASLEACGWRHGQQYILWKSQYIDQQTA